VLDLGTGTGNLAGRFALLGAQVWGIDFSSEMLTKAKQHHPSLRLVQADLLADLPEALPDSFDAIVSAYVLHEFSLRQKVTILQRAAKHLARGGKIVVGDIAFETEGMLEQARQHWQNVWDDDEHYWAADQAVATLEQAGFAVSYTQVSACGGIFVVTLNSR
jgi:putative AdoMet-dependent methyltransferase